MVGTEDWWDEYWTEMERAKFALTAAELLLEETEKEITAEELRSYKREHSKFIRAAYKHMRRAKRIRKKIERFEKKASNHNG